MNAEMREAHDRAQAARVSAWALLMVSLTALGATLAALHSDSYVWAAVFASVAWLTGWGAGAERAEMRECREELEWIGGR